MQNPLLSIGIIFKNEIRCIERCLKSLQPLREAIPCEVVMADTGAEDGSRTIAEKYADILIDFPWIGDFAAARNAVMDRCAGKWFMSIDCDEWLEPDIEGYTAFLTTDKKFDFASVVIRNYDTVELDKGGSYSDFLATRLLRMSTGLRYEGTVHEHWPYKGDLQTMMIRGAVFHHDGYVYQDRAKLQEKQERNMTLLRKQLEEDPDNLIILNQCVESSANTPEQEGYLRRALAGVLEKRSEWELFGPPICRHAVRMAMRDNLAELEEWIQQAETMFPDSIFLRVEIAYFAFGHYWNTDDYVQALRWGEKYLQGVEDYHAGRFERADLLASALDKTDTHSRLSVATVLASGYLHENQPEKCADLMEKLNPQEMNAKQVADCVQNFCQLRESFAWNTDEQMASFWDRLEAPVPSLEKAEQRKNAFLQMGAKTFVSQNGKLGGAIFGGSAYTVFLPLAGKCVLGDAAAILGTKDPKQLEALLREQEDVQNLPIFSLAHALECGVHFPLRDKAAPIEVLDDLAIRLAGDPERFYPLVFCGLNNLNVEDWPGLVWIRGLILAALQCFPWTGETWDEERGMALAQGFAKVEQAFLPRCYSNEVLREDRLFTLPPLHRFGWCCAQAFSALEQGNPVEYVRLLRMGLDACKGMKPMVEFLVENTQQVQQILTPPELRLLADQIRVVLGRYDPEDPAVAALKASPAYQKVAYLIEGASVPGADRFVQ